jgi:hypothetical protein
VDGSMSGLADGMSELTLLKTEQAERRSTN